MIVIPEQVRSQLLRNGYVPVPCIGKKPLFNEWQKLKPTVHEVERWSRTAPAASNTGILTRTTPTLDIDIFDPEAAAAIEELARERFEEHGYVLTRFGSRLSDASPSAPTRPSPRSPSISRPQISRPPTKRRKAKGSNSSATASNSSPTEHTRTQARRTHGAATDQPRSGTTICPIFTPTRRRSSSMTPSKSSSNGSATASPKRSPATEPATRPRLRRKPPRLSRARFRPTRPLRSRPRWTASPRQCRTGATIRSTQRPSISAN